MKKFIKKISFILVFLLTSCVPVINLAGSENTFTDAEISLDKKSGSVKQDETLNLSVKIETDFTKYKQYKINLQLQKYDLQKNGYVYSQDIFISDKDEPAGNRANTGYIYWIKDSLSAEQIQKNFLISCTNTGKYKLSVITLALNNLYYTGSHSACYEPCNKIYEFEVTEKWKSS